MNNTVQFLTVVAGGCSTVIGVVIVLANAWVKASRLTKIEKDIEDLWRHVTSITEMRKDIEYIKEALADLRHRG